jgi:membrane-associated phospholipid phosphatase
MTTHTLASAFLWLSMRNLREIAAVAALLLVTLTTSAAQTAPCGARSSGSVLGSDVLQFANALPKVPREAVKADNLKWELPVAAATGVLIGAVDRPAADRIQSPSLQRTAGRWSNIGIGMELGSSGVAWAFGCATHHEYAAESAFKSLEAAGLGLTVDLGLKLAFNREYPYGQHSTGEFWEGGKSFPSGHTATSFAWASALAHRYPHNRWIKYGSYALATGVSVSRYPAKKHFPSDILVGAPIGYLVGRFVAEH